MPIARRCLLLLLPAASTMMNEPDDQVTKGILWSAGLVLALILGAGIYASIRLDEPEWLFASMVVALVGAAFVAAALGLIAATNLAVFGPISWLAGKISDRGKTRRDVAASGAGSFERYRTFWRRFWAGVIDAVVLLPLYLIDRWIWASFETVSVLVPWFIAHSLSFVLYSVLMHGYFGQTIGKYITGVKVFDASGSKLSMKQALLRDSVWIVLVVLGLVIDLPTVTEGRNPYGPGTELGFAALIAGYAALGWFALELVTMLSNPRRRAVHDFIARSVVMRVERLKLGATRFSISARSRQDRRRHAVLLALVSAVLFLLQPALGPQWPGSLAILFAAGAVLLWLT